MTCFTGLRIELPVVQTCNECDKPIVNTAALTVSRFRGSASSEPTLYYHKECLFKDTMKDMSFTDRGKCPICSGCAAMNFTFLHTSHRHTKLTGKHIYGNYHRRCVENFVKENEEMGHFERTDEAFAKILNDFSNGNVDINSVKKLVQMDFLFTKIDKVDVLEKCLASNRAAKARFVIDSCAHSLYVPYVEKNLDSVLEIIKSSKFRKRKFFNHYIHEAILGIAIRRWEGLSQNIRELVIFNQAGKIPLELVSSEWDKLSMETKAHFCKCGKITFAFYDSCLKQFPDILYLLAENSFGLDDKVKLIIEEEENVLKKSW